MKILCVDDEPLILNLTAKMCRELPFKPEVAITESPTEALEYLRSNPADIVITDINMPEMDGLVLAAHIKRMSPETAIIFLTGYSEYAVDAFALHAQGYLLKPVSAARLAAEVEYALSMHPKNQLPHLYARTFGNFDLLLDGKAVVFARAKSKELLAYLIDRQGASVTRPAIFSVLWEKGDYDRAMQKQLDVIIRSLKDTLDKYGISEILEISHGTIRIIPEKFDSDLFRYYKGDISAVRNYRGEYMSEYSWAVFTESLLYAKLQK